MKNFTKVLILLTLFTMAFSWTAFFERLEKLKEKKEAIKEYLDLKNLSLPHLKDLNLNDLVHFEAPDIKSKFEKLKHIIPKDLDPAHHKEAGEFWTGVFEYFEFPKPNNLINCYGMLSGQLFIRKIRTLNNLLQHAKTNEDVKLQADLAHFEVIMHALEQAHDCMAQTEDWKRLTDILHISPDHQKLMKAKCLYFQAKFGSLADEFKRIVDFIDNREFNKAGKTYGELLKKGVKDFKNQGEDLLIYQAFSNGISRALGLPLPSKSIACYNSEDAKYLMDFFKGFSHAVADGRWYKAEQSAADYWEKEGKALLEKIPSKIWSCDMSSEDTKKLGEKIGVDLNSQEFRDKMWNYVNNHNILFYNYLRSMNGAFEKNDYLHAGQSYAHLLKAVAKSSK